MDIWLCGGGDLATTLFPEINEIILKVNPMLLGSGIPLFSGAVKQTDLQLADSKVYSNGFMLLRYRVKHRRSGRISLAREAPKPPPAEGATDPS